MTVNADSLSDRVEAPPRRERPASRALVLGPADARMVAFMRFALAGWGLAVILVEPTEPLRLESLTYAALSTYCIWAAILYLAVVRNRAPGVLRWSHWIDVVCATVLVTLSRGMNSIFFFLYVFAMLVASLSRGKREGLLVTGVSAALFLCVGAAQRHFGGEIEASRALTRAVFMIVLGALMAHWGERELELRRRLLLLRDLGRQWKPRLGVNRWVAISLDYLADFFNATRCVLALEREGKALVWCISHRTGHAREGAAPCEIDQASAQVLIEGPRDPAADADASGECLSPEAQKIAILLDTPRFASIPYGEADGTRGRLYVAFEKGGLSEGDLDFLSQATQYISRGVENARLEEQLEASAAQKERFHISLDIHDHHVQPYVGLKLALEALKRQAGPGNPLSAGIAEVVAMAEGAIKELRSFASSLREELPFSAEQLCATVHEHADRLERFYGVKTEVDLDPALRLAPHVAKELFCIVTEGLSNVLRHTRSKKAFVRLSQSGGMTRLAIGNETEETAQRFEPRSIAARAKSMGGTCDVETGNFTVVQVQVPA